MNLGKILGTVVSSVTRTVKQNPKLVLAGSGVLAAGFFTGANLGYKDGIKAERKHQNQIVQTPSQPQATTSTEQTESVFEYVSPTIGERGIQDADTVFFPGTLTPQSILYKGEKGQPVQEERLNLDGSLESFTIYTPVADKHFNSETYDNSGEMTEYEFYNPDDRTTERADKIDNTWSYTTFDNKDRIIRSETGSMVSEYGYKPNGSETMLIKFDGIPHVFYETDKNGNEIVQKDFDESGVVKYTVNTKYDKDGCVIKKDTIWNK